jgi:hypothetical protein
MRRNNRPKGFYSPPSNFAGGSPLPSAKGNAIMDDEKNAQPSEIEELRARIDQLEGEKFRPPPTVRMVELYGGSGVFVPARRETLGEQLVRREWSDIGRAELVEDPAVQAIGREIVADTALHRPMPQPSPARGPAHSQIDTRTGLPSPGAELPPGEVLTRKLVDRQVDRQDMIDRAEWIERDRKARQILDEE